MCELHMPEALVVLAERGRITPDDVNTLKTAVYPNGLESFTDAEALLAIDLAAHDTCPDWEDYILSAIANFAVRPDHNVDMVAEWLRRCISRNGVVDDKQRFDLLARVISELGEVPESLVELALQQVQYAICENKGPLAETRCSAALEIGLRDVELLTSILVDAGCENNVALSSSEMQVLYAINEAAVSGLSNPAWQSLYMRAVSSFLTGTEGQSASRKEHFQGISKEDPHRLTDICCESLRVLHMDSQRPFVLQPDMSSSANTPDNQEKETDLIASLTQFLSGVDELQKLSKPA